METKHYPNTGIPARQLAQIRDYLNLPNSHSLGDAWGHREWWYKLHYPHGVEECRSYEQVASTLQKFGETVRHETFFKSRTGRLLRLDTTAATQITMEIENGPRTASMRKRIETIMGLMQHVRRVFITHGHDSAWFQVQNFIEKECAPALPTLELSYEPSKGQTVIEKLDTASHNCSYAVIVMTGEDNAENQVRVRENVMHEIGFFQGRYGRNRVCLLHENDVSIPSNLGGVVYCTFPKGRVTAALIELQRELRAAFPDDP